MVELFEQDIRTNDRQSSKGNQLKWQNGSWWYKADYIGYEGLAEYVISHLLQRSTLGKEEYALYHLEQIKYKSVIYQGVRSEDFLKDGWQLVTLERLFQNAYGRSLYKSIYQIEGCDARLRYLVEQVERVTGLEGFGEYMSKLLTIDALFLNEDRHMHNVAVLMNRREEFRLCPFFDHGAGLLSDTTMEYPLGEDIYALMKTSKAKTICTDYDEQLDAAEQLYGRQMSFSFSKQDVRRLLSEAPGYTSEVVRRVEDILLVQMQKYRYLFV